MPGFAGIPSRGRTFPATALDAPRREEPAAPQRLRTAKVYIFGTVLVKFLNEVFHSLSLSLG